MPYAKTVLNITQDIVLVEIWRELITHTLLAKFTRYTVYRKRPKISRITSVTLFEHRYDTRLLPPSRHLPGPQRTVDHVMQVRSYYWESGSQHLYSHSIFPTCPRTTQASQRMRQFWQRKGQATLCVQSAQYRTRSSEIAFLRTVLVWLSTCIPYQLNIVSDHAVAQYRTNASDIAHFVRVV